MFLAKVVFRGVLVFGSISAAAHGGPMLVLGVFSNQSDPTPPTSAPSYSFPSFSNSAPVQFGSYSNSNSAPMANPTPPPAYSPPSSINYDATINFGSGSFPNAGSLTTGNPSSWALSQPVESLFGGVPTARQQADFENAVIQHVGQTFRQSGVPLSLTDDLSVATAHTLSVVGNSTNPNSPQVIGMTYLGGNGFHYIDQSARSANSVDQLEWIVAHNISHELMLAFGVPELHDASGNYIDSRNANWSMMIDPNARFSDGAASDLLSRNFRILNSANFLAGAQYLETQTVPEPATFAAWAFGLGTVLVWRRSRSRKA